MALRWLPYAHKELNITLICRPFVCQHISNALNISFATIPPVEKNSENWIEHLVFSISPFGEKPRDDSWDSYPCGTLSPFFLQYNRIPFVPSSPLRILVLSRSNRISTNRQLNNEDELIDRLRSLSPHIQVDTFIHSDPISEDIKAFQSANVIIGLHGGAFSNLVYCRRGTVVIEMNVPDEGGRQCFAYVAYNLGLRYHRYGVTREMYDSYAPGVEFYFHPVRVNVNAFASFLKDVLQQRSLVSFQSHAPS